MASSQKPAAPAESAKESDVFYATLAFIAAAVDHHYGPGVKPQDVAA